MIEVLGFDSRQVLGIFLFTGAHLASYPMGTGGYFPEIKAAWA
jgi:hypothetical protein